jgi:hypothetical protein
MSTKLLNADGTKYPIAEVFVGGVLDTDALAKYGIPSLSGTFAYAMFMANAAVSTLAYDSLISSRTKHLLDRCPCSPLHSLLGWGHRQSVQRRKKRVLQ